MLYGRRTGVDGPVASSAHAMGRARAGDAPFGLWTPSLVPASADTEARAEDPVAQRIRILDKDGNEVGLSELLDALAQRDVVFLGETHLDDVTHRVELAVFEGIADRRKNHVVLSLEMFERDVQPLLDDYLHGKVDEAKLLADGRPWGNYATDYRPLVEAARTRSLPVVAANLPRPVVSELANEGQAAWTRIKKDHPSWVP